MKATWSYEYLVCECGEEMRTVYLDNSSAGYTCTNRECQYFKKVFKPPMIELEEVKP